MAQGVVYQDASGKIISANPAAERILGLTFDQMRGVTSLDPRWRTIREDGSPLPGEEHPSMLALRTGKPVFGFVMGVYSPTFADRRWILVNAGPQCRAGETTPYQVYATFEDITDRYKLFTKNGETAA
jgi:two-component system CheB/CheR fusion protein